MQPTEVGYLTGGEFDHNTVPEKSRPWAELLYALMAEARDRVMQCGKYDSLGNIAGRDGCFKIENPRKDGSRGLHECGIGGCRVDADLQMRFTLSPRKIKSPAKPYQSFFVRGS